MDFPSEAIKEFGREEQSSGLSRVGQDFGTGWRGPVSLEGSRSASLQLFGGSVTVSSLTPTVPLSLCSSGNSSAAWVFTLTPSLQYLL